MDMRCSKVNSTWTETKKSPVKVVNHWNRLAGEDVETPPKRCLKLLWSVSK